MHKPEYSHGGYIRPVFETDVLRKNVAKAVKILKRYEFDSIAFRGMSGALIAPILALRLNKTLIMVRKENDGSHFNLYSGSLVEGDKAARSYVVVDDFVSTGETLYQIIKEIKEFNSAKYIGTLEIRDMPTLEDIKSGRGELLTNLSKGYGIKKSMQERINSLTR